MMQDAELKSTRYVKKECEPRICDICGVEFLTARKNTKRCSPECRKKYYRKKYVKVGHKPKKCGRCNFQLSGNKLNEMYCGKCFRLRNFIRSAERKEKLLCPHGWFLVYISGNWCCQPEWLARQNKAKGYDVYGMEE